jgi:hypothetical protein
VYGFFGMNGVNAALPCATAKHKTSAKITCMVIL